MSISWMLIMPSFKKSLIVEQFQGNYLKHITLRTLSKERNVFNSIALVPSFLFSFKINCFSSSSSSFFWNKIKVAGGGGGLNIVNSHALCSHFTCTCCFIHYIFSSACTFRVVPAFTWGSLGYYKVYITVSEKRGRRQKKMCILLVCWIEYKTLSKIAKHMVSRL